MKIYNSFFACLILIFFAAGVFADNLNQPIPPPLLKKSEQLQNASIVDEYEYFVNGSRVDSPRAREFVRIEVAKINGAIRSLQEERGGFWDLAEPYVLTFISTFLAIISAVFIFFWQEDFKIRRENLSIANKWMLAGVDIIHSLERYKRTYGPRISNSSGPWRGISVPEIVVETRDNVNEVVDLVFLLGIKPDESHWDELGRIRSLFENYQLVIKLWTQHATGHNEIAKILINENGGEAVHQVDLEQLMTLIPRVKLINHIMICEQAFKLTDDLLIESHQFVMQLPDLVSRRLRCGKFFKLGKLIRWGGGGKDFDLLIKPVPALDIQLFSMLSGYSLQRVEEVLRTGYPYIAEES